MIVTLSVMPDVEKVRAEADDIVLNLDGEVKGRGSVYVDEDALVWWSAQAQRGYLIEYPQIVLHGLVGAGEDHAGAVYCQLDVDGSGETMMEARFGAGSMELVESLYQAICECQLLHPEEEDGDEDDNGYSDGGFMMAAALDGDALSVEGQENMARLSIHEHTNGSVEEGQFEDV